MTILPEQMNSIIQLKFAVFQLILQDQPVCLAESKLVEKKLKIRMNK